MSEYTKEGDNIYMSRDIDFINSSISNVEKDISDVRKNISKLDVLNKDSFKKLESIIEKIDKNIVEVREKIEELNENPLFIQNDVVNEWILRLEDAKSYVEFSLIPAKEKMKELQELLKEKNLNKKDISSQMSNNSLEEHVILDDDSYKYNPQFTSFLNENYGGSQHWLKDIYLSNLDNEIGSLIEEIRELISYDFQDQHVDFTAVQPLYGVMYPDDDKIPSIQPKYGVKPPNNDKEIPSIQPKYGVVPPDISGHITSI